MSSSVVHQAIFETVISADGMSAGAAQGKAALKSLEGAAQSAGAKVGSSIARGAGQAGAATHELDATTKRFLTTLQRESDQAGRTRAEYLALRAAKLGVADSAGPMIARIREAEKGVERVGLTAKQTAAAIRQVPAQFTDIFVALQGGQAPLTVLLQQGGQLKDVFGGVAPAAQALGRYVLALVNPLTLAAGAAAALGYAYFQGSKEGDAYARALILTGNAAGTTADQLQLMAAGVARVAGTQSGAADAVAQIAASGNVAASSIERFATTAVQMERLVGKAVSETVKEFDALGRSPVEASRKLNESQRYLTLSVLEQIKALEDQGRATDAANLAQRTYDDALASRMGKLQDRLGTIESAWRDVRDVAAKAWDAMLGIGRPETGADRLLALRNELADREARGPLNSTTGEAFLKGNERLRQQIALLQSEQDAATRAAAAEGERNRASEAAMKAEGEISRIRKESATNQEKMNKALSDYRLNIEKVKAANPNSALLDPKRIAQDEANIRERFKPPKSRQPAREIDADKSTLEADLAASKRLLDQQVSDFRNAEAILEAERSAGLVSEARYYDEKRKFLKANAQAQDDALVDQLARLEIERAALEAKRPAQRTENDRIRIDRELIDLSKKIEDAEAKRAETTAKAATEGTILSIRQKAAQDALARSFVESQAAAEAYLRTFQNRQDRAVADVGRGNTSRQFNAGVNDIEDRFSERRQQLERERRTGLYRDNEEGYRRELALLEQTKDAELGIYRRGYADLQAAQADFRNGAARAFDNYATQADDIARQTEDAFTNAFKGMEDALVQFASTGKVSFRSLADAIHADLLRIIIRQQISNALGVAGSGGGGDFLSSALGFVLGAAGGGFGAFDTSAAGSAGGITSATTLPDVLRGGRAGGGEVHAGRPYMVGELGRELFIPRTSGTIVPAAQVDRAARGGDSITVTQHFAIAGAADRRTQEQLAAAAYRGARKATARGTA